MYANKPWLKFYDKSVHASIDYPEKSLYSLFEEAVKNFGDNTAYNYYGQQCTYKQLGGLIGAFASALHGLGVKKGDRVAVMLPNCPQFVIAYFAIVRLGAIVVNTNPLYTEREIRHQANDSGAKAIITFVEAIPRVMAVKPQTGLENVILTSLQGQKPEELPEGSLWMQDIMATATGEIPQVNIDPKDDVAVLQYTGGTTGVSKGAMLTHFNLVSNAMQTLEWCDGVTTERIMTVLPLFHVYGMTCCMNFALITGGTMLLYPRFEPKEILEAIKQHQPSVFPGVPTMYTALLNHPDSEQYDLSVVGFFNSGAASMPLELAEKLKKRLAGTEAVYSEGYGLSEASPVTHTNPIHTLIKTGSIGIPYPDTECKVMDIETGLQEMAVGEPGELVIRGPQIMKGYWNKPEETGNTLRNGWLYTGDIAKMDEDGFFYIVDRKKDMIIAGGYNIYPRDIEEVLYEMPQIQEAVVAGVTDPYRGETVKAFIVLKEGQELTVEEVTEFCKKELAPYKVPKLIEFKKELPKSAVGKLLRRVLVEEEKQRVKEAEPKAE
ncbi:MAG: long-chain fatty acid--CoA ligase [Bacillota bacterium]|nr:long-chain fatty acid--CoA ligase [Bacillota bacterium]